MAIFLKKQKLQKTNKPYMFLKEREFDSLPSSEYHHSAPWDLHQSQETHLGLAGGWGASRVALGSRVQVLTWRGPAD